METANNTNTDTAPIERPGSVTGAAWLLIAMAVAGILFLPATPIELIVAALWIACGIGLLNGGNWAKWLFIVVGLIPIILSIVAVPMMEIAAISNGLEIDPMKRELLEQRMHTIAGAKVLVYAVIVAALNTTHAKQYLKQEQ